jgi:hypothetical protein
MNTNATGMGTSPHHRKAPDEERIGRDTSSVDDATVLHSWQMLTGRNRKFSGRDACVLHDASRHAAHPR